MGYIKFVLNIHMSILKYRGFLKYMAPLMGVHFGAMCKYGTFDASPTSYGLFYSARYC